MDYEQKYKEALERARKLQENSNGMILKKWLWGVFPELKENEEESIRKGLIKAVSGILKGHTLYGTDVTREEALTWLEKQGEKKSAYKIEPKFKAGDWIVFNGLTLHIDEVVNGYYRTTSRGDGIHNSYDWDIDNAARLWTIQEAKDGTVLIKEETGEPFIYNGNRGTYLPEFVGAYCGIRNGEFIPNGSSYYWGRPTCPATKEQRDSLFAKMKEAGYKWDSEKKELKKIEQKPTDNVESKFKVGNWYQCTKDFFGKGVTFDKNTAYYCAIEGCLQNEYGCHIAIVKDLYDNFKLWTIQDAKDGDVLVVNNEVFIYAHRKQMYSIAVAHCFIDSEGGFYLEGEFVYGEKGNSIHPSTKEQRDLLFQKMKEAGYKWDNERKELKRIAQKSTDNTEPKFKVGDWIVNNVCFPMQIASIKDGMYIFTKGDAISVSFIDENYHLWTINDAKEGDVLVTSAGVFIYNGNNGGGSCPGSYCGINTLGRFQIGVESHWTGKKVYPATKEQCDLLFQKMKEAGYEWDSEKKELKKRG